ncbi:MAG: S1 RNA-binding domain-containing protein [Candidatus Aenigmarchaeota archaeon]|nr:S1 RNA-binding domain-containing protein [Candidatus Aenigmarchaeota archaeon]
MVKKRGMPGEGELVIARITKINPNSAFAFMEEYGKEGMIHISEVSHGWVRDIRQHLKVGQTGVAKVMRIEGNVISLSIKRVDENQRNQKTKEYNLEGKAERLLEIAAQRLGMTLEQAYEEVGYLLQERLGSIYEGFRSALNAPDKLQKRGVPEKWIAVIKEIAEKNIEQKEFEFRARLIIKTYKPDGIDIIKQLLKKAKSSGLDVRYIAAPEYLVKYRTKDAKKGEKLIGEKLSEIAKTKDAEVKFEITG